MISNPEVAKYLPDMEKAEQPEADFFYDGEYTPAHAMSPSVVDDTREA